MKSYYMKLINMYKSSIKAKLYTTRLYENNMKLYLKMSQFTFSCMPLRMSLFFIQNYRSASYVSEVEMSQYSDPLEQVHNS